MPLPPIGECQHHSIDVYTAYSDWNSLSMVQVSFTPAQWDIKPMIFQGKGQCLSEAEKEPRAKPEALVRLHSSTDLSYRV